MSNARQKQRSPNNLLQFVRALNARRVKIARKKIQKWQLLSFARRSFRNNRILNCSLFTSAAENYENSFCNQATKPSSS